MHTVYGQWTYYARDCGNFIGNQLARKANSLAMITSFPEGKWWDKPMLLPIKGQNVWQFSLQPKEWGNRDIFLYAIMSFYNCRVPGLTVPQSLWLHIQSSNMGQYVAKSGAVNWCHRSLLRDRGNYSTSS